MRPAKWIGGKPAAIPKLGAILEVDPDDWRYNPRHQPLRIRIEQVHVEVSRRYNGTWVWVEGLAQLGISRGMYRQALLRTDAIPAECRDRKYRPPSVYTINPAELRPGNLVRVGRQASGRVGHTFNMRIATVGDPQPDGRIPLTGYRITLAGRVVERTSVCAYPHALYPVKLVLPNNAD
ncbi:MAG: hypothetical protein JXA67_20190 [Micromonosporaceae bacterium]|nr:hypothetical protein [Micromonosporaceae bacterium]